MATARNQAPQPGHARAIGVAVAAIAFNLVLATAVLFVILWLFSPFGAAMAGGGA